MRLRPLSATAAGGRGSAGPWGRAAGRPGSGVGRAGSSSRGCNPAALVPGRIHPGGRQGTGHWDCRRGTRARHLKQARYKHDELSRL